MWCLLFALFVMLLWHPQTLKDGGGQARVVLDAAPTLCLILEDGLVVRGAGFMTCVDADWVFEDEVFEVLSHHIFDVEGDVFASVVHGEQIT